MDFRKKLFALVIPIALQQFMLNLVSALDAVMLGSIGQNELSAVSLAGQVQFVFHLFIATVTIGSNIFVAQYWGKKDTISVEKLFAIALRIVVPIGLLFTVVTAVCPSAVMRIFTAEAALLSGGAVYLRAVSLSYFLCAVSQIYLCIMKNCGMAKKSTRITSLCAVLDIFLNAVLIFGLLGMPKMGIAGAAVSTVIVRLIEAVWAAAALEKSKTVHLRSNYLMHPDERLQRDFRKYATPVLGNELVWGIGFTMSSVIMGHLGGDATAAHSIAGIAKNLVVCVSLGLGSGGGIIVGNELGAGNLGKAKVYGIKIAKLSIVSGIISGLVLLGISPLIVGFADLTDTAAEYLKWMLMICSGYLIGKSVNSTTIGGIFCAGGDSKFGFWCDTVTLWCITVPLGMLAAFVWKLPVIAVYVIISLDEFIKLPAVYLHFKQYKWVKDLTIKELKL